MITALSNLGTISTSLAAERPEPMLKIRPPRGWAALDLASVWAFRDLTVALASRDVKLRYKQTALGVIWVLIQPLLAAGIFAFVFGKVAKMSSDGQPLFIFSFTSMLAWNLFNNTITKASMSLVGNSQLISKIFFPRLVLPVSTILSSLIDFAVALCMMAALMGIYHIHPTMKLLLLPAWVLLVLSLALGIGLWTAALTVTYRDVQYILTVFMQMLLYASPIAYSIRDMSAKVRMIYNLNPLTAILQGFRFCIIGGDAPSWQTVLYSVSMSLGLLIVGAVVFKHMERKFADVI
jgi:lipopolysaccharide transport system permease protein